MLDRLIEQVPQTPRQFTPVRLRQPALPALLLRFVSPHSYTGEDAAEIQVPGNPALLDRLLHQAIDADDNARLAQPGEFTFRAYTAGKLDLTQGRRHRRPPSTPQATANSVPQRCCAKASSAANPRKLVDALGNLLALVEAGIDFTDQEDVIPIAPAALDQRLADLQAKLHHVLDNSRPWGAIQTLPRVVLVGPPSAGKSTLFNALLKKQRAVIDDRPGTTRDVLEEPLTLIDTNGQQAEVMLVDIAGLDDAVSQLDRAVQDAANDAMQRADLLLIVNECKAESCETPGPASVAKLHVATKADLQAPSRANLAPHVCKVSAQTGQGLDALREKIAAATQTHRR